ncbi:MAG: hypothetical protein QM796_12965 [Chthoniobacteraceae bacterium]
MSAAASSLSPAKTKKLFRALFVGGWVCALTIPLAWLSASHDLPFQANQLPVPLLPKADDLVVAGKWQLIHFVASDCPCSRSVIKHLVHRGALHGVFEEVILVGADPMLQTQLQARGFMVRTVTEQEIAKLPGLHGVPGLFVRSPAQELVYSGGYVPTGVVFLADNLESSLLARLQAGEKVAAYQVTGCVASQRIGRELDPLQARYSSITVQAR